MIATKYHGEFKDRKSVALEFDCVVGRRYDEDSRIADDFPTEDQILYAEYECPPYCGSAFVLFERDGKLYEVTGSHCSCYGLEGQWAPEETTWAALAIRKPGTLTYSGTPAAVITEANQRLESARSEGAVARTDGRVTG